jgi:Ser-tRNA(Ala) deacylase AlaX
MSLNNQEWEKLRDMINAWPDDSDRILMHRVINRERQCEVSERINASIEIGRRLEIGRRHSLLARMAGNIASGFAAARHRAYHFKMEDQQTQAEADWAVDLAERILKRIGL